MTMQLNTARSTAADIQNAQIIHTRHPHTHVLADGSSASRTLSSSGSRALHTKQATCPCTDIYPALHAIRVAFAPGVPVVNSHVRLLHLHFLHFITPTHSAMSNPHRHVNPSQTCQTLTDMSNPHRHVNPSQTLLALPCCTSTFLSARCRPDSLRVAAECPPP